MVAVSACVVAIVQRSLLLWLPGPSVTQLPLFESWQYALPLVMTHMAGGAGGSGGGVGGEARADAAQMVKPL